jgi:uncharacterized protein YbjT (DUF2867 family)
MEVELYMSNVLVIGAHGQVGQKIVARLNQKETPVFAGVRNVSQFSEYADYEHVTPVQFDLTSTPKAMTKFLKDNQIQQIIFTAGSGGNTGDDQTLIIDLDGAIKTMQAAVNAGVKRYVMVSAMGADDRSFWSQSGLHPYYIAKHYADAYLKQSGLDYTIVRPAALTNGDAQNQVAVVTKRQAGMQIARDDVATFVVATLDNLVSIHQIYAIAAGNQKISTVFSN